MGEDVEGRFGDVVAAVDQLDEACCAWSGLSVVTAVVAGAEGDGPIQWGGLYMDIRAGKKNKTRESC